MPRQPRGSRRKRVHRSSSKRKKHFARRRSSRKKKNRNPSHTPSQHNQQQRPRQKKPIYESGTKICIRKQEEAVAYIKHPNSKHSSYLVQFKNGACAWYGWKKIKVIDEEQYNDAASDFEIDKNLPSPSPTPSLAESSYFSATPSAVESEGDTQSEIDGMIETEDVDDEHKSNEMNPSNLPDTESTTNTVTTESEHKTEIPNVFTSELSEPIDTVDDAVNDIDTASIESVDQKDPEQNVEDAVFQNIESLEIENTPNPEVEEKSNEMAPVCDPMESGNAEISEESEPEIVDEIESIPNPIENEPKQESESKIEDQRGLTLRNSESLELVEGDDAQQIAVIDTEDTESKEEETQNMNSINSQNEIIDKPKLKKKNTKKKRKKTKSVDSVKMKVEVSKFEKKMKMYYKVSDLRERAFLIMCDESKRIDINMLFGYIEHFGGQKPDRKEVKQFFNFMKPNASEMVTFSKFVRAIDDDGDVIAAMKRFLESGDSRTKK